MLTSTDTRNDFQKMSRRDVWRALDNAGIEYKPGIKQCDGVKLLQAHGINPRDVIEWEAVHVPQQNGTEAIQYHPKHKPVVRDEASEMRRDAELSRRVEEAIEREGKAQKKADDSSKELEKIREENRELKNMLLELRSMVQNGKIPASEDVTDYGEMKMPQLKKLAKQRGLTVPITTKKPEIIALLRGLDNGEDAN